MTIRNKASNIQLVPTDTSTASKAKTQQLKEEINKLIRSMSDDNSHKVVDTTTTTTTKSAGATNKSGEASAIKQMQLIVTKGSLEAALFYLKTCSCLRPRQASRLLSIKQLVPGCYQGSSEIVKSIKSKKERLAKTTYYNNMFKLKEYYVKQCRSLNCFGCVLFTVKEIVFDQFNEATSLPTTGNITFKKYKRLLAIRPDKISLIDYKTKTLIRSERMSDLKSWLSGDGYYNLTPVYLLNPRGNMGDGFESNPDLDAFNQNQFVNQTFSSQFANFFRFGRSFDMDKLFVIQFRSCKWHLQIGKFFFYSIPSLWQPHL